MIKSNTVLSKVGIRGQLSRASRIIGVQSKKLKILEMWCLCCSTRYNPLLIKTGWKCDQWINWQHALLLKYSTSFLYALWLCGSTFKVGFSSFRNITVHRFEVDRNFSIERHGLIFIHQLNCTRKIAIVWRTFLLLSWIAKNIKG